MHFPTVEMAGWAATILGVGTLAWYYRLSREEKERADRHATELASEMFGKAIGELNRYEKVQVHNRVREMFN